VNTELLPAMPSILPMARPVSEWSPATCCVVCGVCGVRLMVVACGWWHGMAVARGATCARGQCGAQCRRLPHAEPRPPPRLQQQQQQQPVTHL
jgi:hypothetical protein